MENNHVLQQEYFWTVVGNIILMSLDNVWNMCTISKSTALKKSVTSCCNLVEKKKML